MKKPILTKLLDHIHIVYLFQIKTRFKHLNQSVLYYKYVCLLFYYFLFTEI